MKIYKIQTSSFNFVRKKNYLYSTNGICIYDLNVLRAIQNISINLKLKTKIYKKQNSSFTFVKKKKLFIFNKRNLYL